MKGNIFFTTCSSAFLNLEAADLVQEKGINQCCKNKMIKLVKVQPMQLK